MDQNPTGSDKSLLTNQIANQIIQEKRLIRARELLMAGEQNITEAAFATGFSSPAYFVKCFKDKFEVTPGNYLKGHERQ